MTDNTIPELTYDQVKTATYALPQTIVRGMRLCIKCLRPPFYFADDHARDEGHIYSTAGVREFGISQYCEYCFDKLFADTVTDTQEPLGPLAEGALADHEAMAGSADDSDIDDIMRDIE